MHPLTALRRELHAHPELSGYEHATHDRIAGFIRQHAPSAKLIEHIGTTGLAAVINPDATGPTLIYRADTDALPIHEQTQCAYASTTPGIMHACGHDGHSAIAAGLVIRFAADPPPDRRIVVVFQPAEETGEGARAVLDDPAFTDLITDPANTRALAIHNLPGFPLGQLVLKAGPMCPASVGLRLILTGTAGHSSQPHLSRSPLPVAAALVESLTALPKRMDITGALLTPTYIGSGLNLNFGITPAEAIVCATLRAMRDAHLDAMLTHAVEAAAHQCDRARLTLAHATYERFAAAINNADIAQAVIAATESRGFDHTILETPMPWSEDFGRFTDAFPGMLIGLGSGVDQPHLHASDYDFPDELIEPAVDRLAGILRSV